MNNGLEGLYRLGKADIKRAAEMLGRAFCDDPHMLHAFAEQERGGDKLLYFFQPSLRYGLKYGEVYAPTSEIEGIASWVSSDKLPITFFRAIRVASLWVMFNLVRKIGMGIMKRMSYLGGYLDEVHKRLASFDHCFLMLLGVDPVNQGKGYASRLLRPMFDRLDEQGMPCYLDTFTETDVQFYEHFGFKVLEKIDIPDTDITSWAMLREPR